MANTHSLDLESGSNQYAAIADGSQTGLDITTDYSIEAWVKIESSKTHVVVGKDNVGVSRAYRFIINSDNTIRTTFYGSGSLTDFQSNPTITTGVWTHIAVTVDISVPDCTFYINGSSVAKTTNSSGATTIDNSTAEFAIGRNLNSGSGVNYFDGLVDEVRVWSDIRTAGEISNNYETELTGSEANLVGYWKLNNNYLDETSNNNDLTASGSPVFSTDIPFDKKVPGSVLFFPNL